MNRRWATGVKRCGLRPLVAIIAVVLITAILAASPFGADPTASRILGHSYDLGQSLEGYDRSANGATPSRGGASSPHWYGDAGRSPRTGAGVTGFGFARNTVAGSTDRFLWTSWQNYPKVMRGGREYAQIGDRLYTRHAVDRLQPSGLGAPAGAVGAGRSISPTYVEDVISSSRRISVKGPHGEPRLSYTSGSVQVITEDGIVVTVITR